MTTPATTSTDVHVEIPGFAALYEGAVDWRACAAVAIEETLAALEKRQPDAAHAKSIWQTMIANGWVTKDASGKVMGATMADVHAYVTQETPYKTVDWLDYRNPPNLDAIHALLKAATLAKRPVIALFTNAAALPDNEAHVAGHFTAGGGIDSVRGYLIANGDTQTAIRTGELHPPLNWATWTTLERAQIAALLVIHDLPPAPPPPAPEPPTTEPVPTATIATLKSLIAQVQSLSQQIHDALSAL